ncbi:hypothetical protein BC828DRAFT_404256 [Blastocladiella britannica]|nr:hypothetical protein BC828DRAFT_404256 [Blastocladiella britannica]
MPALQTCCAIGYQPTSVCNAKRNSWDLRYDLARGAVTQLYFTMTSLVNRDLKLLVAAMLARLSPFYRPRSNTSRFSSLDSFLIDDAAACFLVARLPPSLTELVLSTNQITDQAVAAFATNLPATLTKLDLSYTWIEAAGAKSFASALPPSLTTLRLDRNEIGDAGAIAIAEHMPPQLVDLDLSSTDMGDAGARALAASLPRSFLKLLLAENNTGDVGAQAPLRLVQTALEDAWDSRNNELSL